MLLGRLFEFGSAARSVDLDGLATLELPASFHLDDTPERQLPVARRLRRQPYLHRAPVSTDQLTYYLPSHDSQGLGGRKVPALLRVTLYADDVPLADAPDRAYFHTIALQDYHYDGQREAVYARAAPVGAGLYFTEEPQTSPGFFSVQAYQEQHLILTDPAQHVRLFLSADDRELSRSAAEKLLRQVLSSIRREPAALARHFQYLRHFFANAAAIKEENGQANLLSFNQQLAGAGLLPLRPVELYQPGRFVDVGDCLYGVNEDQCVQFFARLGTSTVAQPTTPPYFTASDPAGRYLASFNQQAILQQGVPAGQEPRYRTGVSPPLWFPPEEFVDFRLADLLRETDESRARAQRQPGFAAARRRAPTYWNLSRAEGDHHRATLGQPADYRHAGLMYGDVTETHFTLHYLGTRTTDGRPPELVFTLEVFDGSTRYRTVAADAQYFAVDASRDGQLQLTVVGVRYRVRIEPPAQGQLTVEARE